jgi:hypothetical protein
MNTIETIIPTICISGVITIFAFAGLFLLFKLMKNFFLAKQSKHWLTTPGKVVFSGVESQTTTDESGTTTTYLAKVIYEYQVADQFYQHNRIAFNSDTSTINYKSQAAISARYQPEETILVYYDPENPAEAVLERKVTSVFTTIIIAAVFLGISFFVIFIILKMKPPPFLLNLLGK